MGYLERLRDDMIASGRNVKRANAMYRMAKKAEADFVKMETDFWSKPVDIDYWVVQKKKEL